LRTRRAVKLSAKSWNLIAHGRYETALVADEEDSLAVGEPAGEQVLLGRLQLLDALRLEDRQLHRLPALVEVRVVDQSHLDVRRLPQLQQPNHDSSTHGFFQLSSSVSMAYPGFHFGGIDVAQIIYLPGRELDALAILSL